MERNNGMEPVRAALARIPRWILVCMGSSLLCGLLIHGFMMTNKLPNHDDVAFLNSIGYTLVSGRWFLALLGKLGEPWSMPWVNGLVAIVCTGGASCFILATLSQRDTVSAAVLPFLLLSFPSAANIFSYMYFAGVFFFGILLTSAAVYCVARFHWAGLPAGVVLLACAMGVYQAYVCFAAGLLLLWAIRVLLDPAQKPRAVLWAAVRALLLLAVSTGVYVLVLRVCLRLSGTQLFSYQGISAMGSLKLSALPRLCVRAYREIANYFVLKPPAFVPGALRVANAMLLIGMAGMLLCLLLWSRETPLWRRLLCAVMAGLLPLALAGIYVIAPDSNVHMVMLYPYALYYVAGLFLLAQFLGRRPEKRAAPKLAAALVALCLLLSGLCGALVSNRAYLASKLAFDRAYAFFNRMVLRLEDSGLFEPGDTLAVVGSCHQDFFGEEAVFADIEGMTGFDKAADMLDYDAGARSDFLRTYVGLNAAYDDYYQWNWQSVPEIVEMPAYPAEGSIRRVGDAVIVKMGD